MKKYYALLLFLTLGFLANAQTPWDGTATAWTKGDGTSNNPYLIENGQHLAYLSQQVKNGETYKGQFFKLTANLNMGADAEQKFTPIGFYDKYMDTVNQGAMIDESKYFLGVFDGNYKVIDNIHIYYIDPNADNQVGGTGLFACISENTVIKNLGIGENSIVEGKDATGSFVGAMEGGTIENCHSEAVLQVEAGGWGSGGIVGSAAGGSISGCYNTGIIKGHNNVGGIIGYADGKATINNCYNTGMVNFGGFFAGGLVGYLVNATISNSYTTGSVSNSWSSNAAIGTTENNEVSIAGNCYYCKEKSGTTDKTPGVTEKNETDMKDASFVALLNGSQEQTVWVSDTQNINEGFPILAWQNSSATGIQKPVENSICNIYSADRSIVVECPADKYCQMIVSDLAGATIANLTFTGKYSLDITNSGIYVVTVKTANCQHTAKVVIK